MSILTAMQLEIKGLKTGAKADEAELVKINDKIKNLETRLDSTIRDLAAANQTISRMGQTISDMQQTPANSGGLMIKEIKEITKKSMFDLKVTFKDESVWKLKQYLGFNIATNSWRVGDNVVIRKAVLLDCTSHSYRLDNQNSGTGTCGDRV